ncbi:uncharacterized protein LOC131047836 [Cryptomeria japonica]|uniref:uncharacterized protein LOC131047836 n=1 Tax=Cryptomeria japonica TaxID=3369 RepID=UPI0025ABD9EC|nr:uncharacterized protein LOC131047836 [Cryptomeria japonica]
MTGADSEEFQINEVGFEEASFNIEHTARYTNVAYYLKHMKCPDNMTDNQKRTLKLKSLKYVIINGDLYWKNRDGILLLCLDIHQAKGILQEMHDGVCSGHFSAKTTAHKILRAGYYLPHVFNDAYACVRKCEACQRFSKYQGALPLRPMQVEEPFQQWGLDFIGEISDKSSGRHRWILVATDYLTKWVEAIPTKQATSKVVIKFLMENIFVRFGVPARIITDNGMYFRSEEFNTFCEKYGSIVSHSSPYHPQGNGVMDKLNPTIKISSKLSRRCWDRTRA